MYWLENVGDVNTLFYHLQFYICLLKKKKIIQNRKFLKYTSHPYRSVDYTYTCPIL